MNKIFLAVLAIATSIAFACNKVTNLPKYTPPVSRNFSVLSLAHTRDTVNAGDTIYLTATGFMADTTKSIYAYLGINSTVSGVSTTYNFGTAAAPITLVRTIGADSSGLYSWTSTIAVPGVTNVPAKTKLSITGNFIYQNSLSSEQGTLTQADAGMLTKTIVVE